MSVGSFSGTSGALFTTSCPFARKKSRKVERTTDADLLMTRRKRLAYLRDADDLLAARRARVGARVLAGEDVLELHHPGVREHERRIVLGDERRALHHLVPLRAEEVEEGRAYDGCRLAHDETETFSISSRCG